MIDAIESGEAIASLDACVVYDHVNRDVLKSFKNLQQEKTFLYTSATNEYLTCISDKAMIVYDNPKEIDFEGTYRLTRNKLIAVDTHNLGTSPEKAINLEHFTQLGSFGRNISELQRFCYDGNVRINMADITPTIEQLLTVYKNYKLYSNNNKAEVMFVFNTSQHKTYVLSKLV